MMYRAVDVAGTSPYVAYIDRPAGVLRLYAFTRMSCDDIHHTIALPLQVLIANEVVDLGLKDPERVFVGSWHLVGSDAHYVVVSEVEQTFEAYKGSRA